MNDYPTEEQLQKIREWDYADFDGLLNYVIEIYNHNFGSFGKNPKKSIIVIITGGWSGNEDIISAMSENVAWWGQYWDSSSRGGKYIFINWTKDEDEFYN